MRGLLTLTWLEIKIFVREPLGVMGTVGIPVVMFVVLGRIFARPAGASPRNAPDLVTTDLPVLAAILIALSAVLSLITIIAIYREGGILKRLRATPLRSHTILLAHVLVKLLFTALTLVAVWPLALLQNDPIGRPWCADRSGEQVVGPAAGSWAGLAHLRPPGQASCQLLEALSVPQSPGLAEAQTR